MLCKALPVTHLQVYEQFNPQAICLCGLRCHPILPKDPVGPARFVQQHQHCQGALAGLRLPTLLLAALASGRRPSAFSTLGLELCKCCLQDKKAVAKRWEKSVVH
jgi:hypothetical protein